MTEILKALDAITSRVLAYRPKDKGVAATKMRDQTFCCSGSWVCGKSQGRCWRGDLRCPSRPEWKSDRYPGEQDRTKRPRAERLVLAERGRRLRCGGRVMAAKTRAERYAKWLREDRQALQRISAKEHILP